MKVVILAGGMGTRISEESHLKPKPMIEIGERPILWHIMKIYSHYGFNEFIICLGYKSNVVKDYFANYFMYESDVTFNFRSGKEIFTHQHFAEKWSVTLVNTGLETQTGGRVKRIQKYVGNEAFMLTYGDGVSDVNISHLIDFHNAHGKYVTVTAAQPLGRFGSLNIRKTGEVAGFVEKPKGDNSWINGGFFVMQPEVFNYMQEDDTYLEQGLLQKMADEHQLLAYRHEGFWQPMDTLRDKHLLDDLWRSGKAPWKVWESNGH
ncbi:MAG TPA: glucose-1-phosphate cytidylyltransferase [Deltaproteobacteria bacterium]|nr:glucose-1-phosphate cytidylyltransferase [Deltaproteobacteria bacterium]HPJ92656.1 glucose-1-phosphate cytidylyltransferase [Deltaproteobacteria bacterium]HPR55208.1 glucose-1-phosphate cytidylyltransferase [Deltaproteobacteria bacterium]